jgi:predicted hotdog family 3-hydroxylacyl-ACP dehydratase
VHVAAASCAYSAAAAAAGCFLQVGKRHDMSAGLLIGGKAVSEEATRVNAMNILVATPGALSHSDSSSFLFSCAVDSAPDDACSVSYVVCSF